MDQLSPFGKSLSLKAIYTRQSRFSAGPTLAERLLPGLIKWEGKMMIQSFTKNHDLTGLLHNLREYGLDPREWTLEKISDEQFLIQSLDDDNFTFAGIVDKNTKPHQWKKIELYSL
jgi:hypothetical protein